MSGCKTLLLIAIINIVGIQTGAFGFLFYWPQPPKPGRPECKVSDNDRESCGFALSKSDCERRLKCCWDQWGFPTKRCFRQKRAVLHKSCADAYNKGNRASGIHTLQDKKGNKLSVYCLFESTRGYTFYNRDAVQSSDLLSFPSDIPYALILQRRTDGIVMQAKVKQLKTASDIQLKVMQNQYGDYAKPAKSGIYGNRYLYLGFLDKAAYSDRKGKHLGFISNSVNVTYKNCDEDMNSYAIFYPNMKDKKDCDLTNWKASVDFRNSFERSKFSEVMKSKDFWFSLEMNFGGCGFHLSSAGCREFTGFAIGIPFALKEAQCRCSGDPHCTSFDRKKVDFMGTCQYTLVQDGCSDGVFLGTSTFKIIVDFHRRHPRAAVSYTKAVHVQINGFGTISLLPKNRVTINGKLIRHYPAYPLPGVKIKSTFLTVTVELQTGVKVIWSSFKYTVTVNVPGTMHDEVCGLCGNYNGDPKDDWIMGPGQCPNDNLKEGEKATRSKAFGFSWHAANDNDAGCKDECDTITDPDPVCPKDKEKQAKAHCHSLWDTNGRFRNCLKKIPKQDLDSLVEDCVYDTCIVGDGDDQILCAQAQTLVMTCKNRYGVTIEKWRDTKFCPLTCPANMMYRSCGSPDQASCDDPNGVESDPDNCEEGCFCVKGYLSDGDKCIKRDACGCVRDGIRYKIGDNVMTDDCSEVCWCLPGKTNMVCQPSGCHESSMCTIRDEERMCVCPPTHTGDGTTCTPNQGECSCSGNLHCLSFDNKWLHFMGNCKYTMAQDGCKDGVHVGGTTFRIVADFSRLDSQHRVTLTRALSINLLGHETVTLFDSGESKIDDETVFHFPVNLASGLIIHKSYGHVRVILPNGITVTWTPSYRSVSVTVPGSMLNQLCGLCGNFNSDSSDDWIMGNGLDGHCPESSGIVKGQVATNPNHFGVSWLFAIDNDDGCSEECDNVNDTNPECSESERQQAGDYCEELSDMNGRFKECLVQIDRHDLDGVVDICVYDSCMTGDSGSQTLCAQAEALVRLCKDKYGVSITGWRDEFFCPLDCPDGLVYKDCGSICQPSCANTQGTDCGPCQEGCFCSNGYLSDGDNCITPDMCGCVMDGIRYQDDETVIIENCSKKCTCKSNQSMECVPNQCHTQATCEQIGDSYDCMCKPPYIGDGYKCKHTNTGPPCYAPPPECPGKPVRGPCIATKQNQTCGVGVMTEHRICYDNPTAPPTAVTVQRKCCIKKCPPNPNPPTPTSQPPSETLPPTTPETSSDTTCADVYPSCEE